MIYIQKLNFLFLRVPRTASTSLSDILQEGFNSNTEGVCTPIYYKNINTNLTYSYIDVHCDIDELIEKKILLKNQIENLDIYGIVRNPIERYISYCSLFFKSNENFRKQFENIENFANNCYDEIRQSLRPQTKWLKYSGKTINNIFSFENIDNFLHHLKYKYQVSFKNLPHHRKEERNGNQINLNYKIINKIQDNFYEDFQLYEKYS